MVPGVSNAITVGAAWGSMRQCSLSAGTVARPIVTEIHDYVRASISGALSQGHNFTNVTEALACNPFVLVAIPPMLCVPDVIFLFCHVAEQEVTLVHVA